MFREFNSIWEIQAYANFMVMTLTKVGPIGAFFSSDPFVETPCTWLSHGFCGTIPSSFI